MKYLITFALAAMALVGGACTSTEIDDAGITAKVKSKMAVDSRTSAMKVKVDTVNGIVTLAGAVPAESERTAAGEVARATEGVKSVVNNIVIDRASTSVSNVGEKAEKAVREAEEDLSDAAVLAKIKAKYVAEGIIGTNVDVVNGSVTLKGEVDDKAEKDKAEMLARNTTGVKNVSSKLTIEKKK
ncbi:MAG: BON domain-containing protein [Blastocatellia bacterium]